MSVKHLPYVHPYKTIAINSRPVIDNKMHFKMPENFLSGYAKIMISDIAYANLKTVLADGLPVDFNKTDFMTRYAKFDNDSFQEGIFFPVKVSDGYYADYMYLNDPITNTSMLNTFKWGSNAKVLVDGIAKTGLSALIFEIPFGTRNIQLIFSDSFTTNSSDIGGMELSLSKEKEIYNDPNIFYDNNGLPKPAAYQITVDSSEKIPVSWTSEDNIYDNPVIANTDNQLMIIDTNRSFLYNPLDKTYKDIVNPFSNKIAGDYYKFYAVDNLLIYEYDSISKTWFPNGLTLPSEPNFIVSGSQAIFARFPYNVINNKTIELDIDNSVVINNSSITGSIDGVGVNYMSTSMITGSTIRYANNDGNNIDLLLEVAPDTLKYVRVTKTGYIVYPNVAIPRYLFEDTDVQATFIEDGHKELMNRYIKNDINYNTILNSDFNIDFDELYILDVQGNVVYFAGKVKHESDYMVDLYFGKTIYQENYIAESEPIDISEPIKIQSLEKGYSDQVYVKDDQGNPYYGENYFSSDGSKVVHIPEVKIDPKISGSWEGTTVYVDAFDGDDTNGDGSKENPYKTLEAAKDNGDNLILMPGKYSLSYLDLVSNKNIYGLYPYSILLNTNVRWSRGGELNLYNVMLNIINTPNWRDQSYNISYWPIKTFNSFIKFYQYDFFSKNIIFRSTSNYSDYITLYSTETKIYFDSTSEITMEDVDGTEIVHVPETMVPEFLNKGYIDTLEDLTLNPNIAKLYEEVVFVNNGQVVEKQGVKTDNITIVREYKSFSDISWSVYNDTDSTETVDLLLNIDDLHLKQGLDDTARPILMNLNGADISARVIQWFDERKIFVPAATINPGTNIIKYVADESNSVANINTDSSDRFKFENSLESENLQLAATMPKTPQYDKKGVRVDDNILNINNIPTGATVLLDLIGSGLGGSRQIFRLKFLEERVGNTGEFWVPVEIDSNVWAQTVLSNRDINNIKFTKDGNVLDVILLMYDPNAQHVKWLVNLNHDNNPYTLAQADTEIFFNIEYDPDYTLDLSKSPSVYVKPKVSDVYYSGGIDNYGFTTQEVSEIVRAGLYDKKFALSELGTGETFTIFTNAGTYHKATDTNEHTLFSLSNKIRFNTTSTGFKCYVQTETSGVASFSSNAHPFESNDKYKIRAIGLYYEPATDNLFTVLDGEKSISAFLNNIGNTMALTGNEKISFGGNVFDVVDPVWSTPKELLNEFMFFNYKLTVEQMRGLSITLEYDDSDDDVDFVTGGLVERNISSISELVTISGKKIFEIDMDGNLILSDSGEFIGMNTLNFQNIVIKISSDNVQILNPKTLTYETIYIPADTVHSLKIGNNTSGYLIADDIVVLNVSPTDNLLKYIGGRFR
jgi:hypothetical protein